jgi:hypothetical protein
MRAPAHTLALALACLPPFACMSMDGVMSVHLELRPLVVVTWPADVEAAEYASLSMAEGVVHADAGAETGWIDVGPLPAPADGYVYVAVLEVVDDPRASLPGGQAGEPGGLAWPVVPLTPTFGPARHGAIGGNWWTGTFTADELGRSVGGLRFARIVLRGVSEERVLLAGSVEEQAAAAPPSTGGGATHEH